MNWTIVYLPEVKKDLQALSQTQRILIRKALDRVKINPLPESEGGYGKPLGKRGNTNLTNFLKIKLRGAGLRIVYRLIRQEGQMLVVVVGVREDSEVYDEAQKRIKRHQL